MPEDILYGRTFGACLLCNVGKSMTADNYLMISCFLCTEGSMFSFYIVCGEGVDFEKYLQYLKMIERN